MNWLDIAGKAGHAGLSQGPAPDSAGKDPNDEARARGCRRVNCVPPKHRLRVLTNPWDLGMGLGNRVSAEVMKASVTRRSYWSRVTLYPRRLVFLEEEDKRQRHMEEHDVSRGRSGSAASTNQGTPRIAGRAERDTGDRFDL